MNKREREVYLFALLRKDFASKRSAVTSHGVANVVDTVYDAGMPVEEVDSSGNITAARKYDGYGLVRSGQAGSSSQKYVGSLGHESDTNTGLIYMRARYMDPVLGRFLSEDPSKDGGNWFVYCGDEPVNHIDSNGKADIAILIWFDGILVFDSAINMTSIAWNIGSKFQAAITEAFLETANPFIAMTDTLLTTLLADARPLPNASVAQQAISVVLIYRAELEIWFGILFGPTGYEDM